MGIGILILKKETRYASLQTLMGTNGKDHAGIYRFIMFYWTIKAKVLNFLKKGRVTYVTG